MFQGMNEPVCLIGSDSDGQLCVLKEAKDILNTITQPVVVVSVVGLYRTGKSYLMNRLAGHQSGFALGSTIESETKGIWMWCVPHPTKPEYTLVLLDTEGLGDVDKGDDKHDTWIFCLAVLLSSTLVYNSLGVIDNVALQNLHYVTEVAENIRVKAQTKSNCNESTELMKIFPAFIWTVRDFTLKLQKNGAEITADKYLESALVLKPGVSAKVQQYNLPRLFLRNFFAERRCFVFNRPAKDDDLQRMEQLTEEELDPRFRQQANEFCSYVFRSAKPKAVLRGRILTGIVLGSLAEVYVAAIRSGEVPCLENAVETLAQLQNGKAVKQALQFYKEKIRESGNLPMEPSVLSGMHGKAEKKAIETFFTISFNDVEQKAQLELMTKVNEEYADLCRSNKEKCRSACEAELKRIFTPLDQGSFMYPGGHLKYKGELQRLTKEYRAKTNKLYMSEEVLTNYLQEKQQLEKNILLADQQLTEANRRQEEQRWRTQALEQQMRALEQQNKDQEQKRQDCERTYNTNIKQLLERTNQEQERAREDSERVLNAKLKEKDALLNEGFQQRADQIHNEIATIKTDMDEEKTRAPSTISTFIGTIAKGVSLVFSVVVGGIVGGAMSWLSNLF